jgi:hypothetical protein
MKIVVLSAVLVSGLLLSEFAWSAQIATCKGVANSKVSAATASAEAQVCTHVAAIAAGTELESKKQISADARAIFASLESQFDLPPMCAGAIVAVTAQGLSNGSVSAGSCPAK